MYIPSQQNQMPNGFPATGSVQQGGMPQAGGMPQTGGMPQQMGGMQPQMGMQNNMGYQQPRMGGMMGMYNPNQAHIQQQQQQQQHQQNAYLQQVGCYLVSHNMMDWFLHTHLKNKFP